MFSFKLATEIIQFDRFAEFIQAYSVGPDDLLITNEVIYNNNLREYKLDCHVLFQEKYGYGEPNDKMINQLIAEAKTLQYSRIIAVGGGTVIDISKILSLKVTDDVLDLLYGKVPVEKVKKLIVIPTTCGTGSEVTNISILEDTQAKVKKGIVHSDLFPDQAVLIPELLKSLPYKFFAFSSIDALIHAVESYLAPRSNPISELFSVKAMNLIISAYQKIVREGKDAVCSHIDEVLLASTFAGIAFANTGVGAVHALSYPLGGGYHVAHGEANYAFFTAVLNRYEQLNPTGKITDLKGILKTALGMEAGDTAIQALATLLEQIIPLKRLREYGMRQDEVDAFTDAAMAQERLMKNNYAALTRDDVRSIYEGRF